MTPDLTTAAAAHVGVSLISQAYGGPGLAVFPDMAALETTIAFIILIGCVLRPLVLVEKDL